MKGYLFSEGYLFTGFYGNFFFALSAKVLRAMCPLWQSSGSDIVTHTHMKNRTKRWEKWKKRMSVSHLNE